MYPQLVADVLSRIEVRQGSKRGGTYHVAVSAKEMIALKETVSSGITYKDRGGYQFVCFVVGGRDGHPVYAETYLDVGEQYPQRMPCVVPPAPVTLGDIAKLLAQMQLLEIGRQFAYCSCGENCTGYDYLQGDPVCDTCRAHRAENIRAQNPNWVDLGRDAPCATLVRRLRAIVEAP